MNPVLIQNLKKSLKVTFLVGVGLSLSVYCWLRLIFYEVPFTFREDLPILIKVMATGWLMAISLKLSFYLLLGLIQFVQSPSKYALVTRRSVIVPLLVVAVAILLFSCKQQSVGVKKDFNTGLTSNYKNMEPGEVQLVMNDEVLNHTDVPIGEKFLIINKDVKGLTQRDGKVSVGCSLTISDQSGTKLLDEADLFAGRDVFNPTDATNLRCTVTTGSPMEWEEKYDVVATFWDKYGDGKIVNKVTIRTIDIP